MIRLRSLGECVIEIGDQELTPESEIVFAFALYLIMNAGKAIPRATLTDLFWPEVEASKARHCLRQTVYRLRGLQVDLYATSRHLQLPQDAAERDFDRLFQQHAPRLTDLHGTLRPSYLPDYAPTFSSRYSDWLERTRTEIEERHRVVLLSLLHEPEARAHPQILESIARACLLLDPLNESATLILAEVLALTARRVEALTLLDGFANEIDIKLDDRSSSVAILRRRIADGLPRVEQWMPVASEFVGRDAAYQRMVSLVRACKSGARTHGCVLWGEAGIGKTRLALEVARCAILEGLTVEWIRCHAGTSSRPLWAFTEIVPRMTMKRGALGCAPESLAYLKRFSNLDANARELSDESLSGLALARRIRRAVLDLFDAVASEIPMLLIVDDADRLDAASWHLFLDLLEDPSLGQLLILITSRTHPSQIGSIESQGALDSARAVDCVHVGGLDEGSATRLLARHAMATNPQLSLEAMRWCVKVANGNPLFLEELGLHIARGSAIGTVPPSIQRLLDTQVRALPSRTRTVLEALAILGPNGSAERLEIVVGIERHELLADLNSLEAASLVVADEALIRCKHDLLLEAVLKNCSASTIALLHRQTAQVLESELRVVQNVALAWDCADHWERGGNHDRSVRFISACSLQLVELGLLDEAIQLLLHALHRCATPQIRLALLRQIRDASRLARRWSATIEVVEESMRIAESLGLPRDCRDEDVSILLEAKLRSYSNPQAVLPMVIENAADPTCLPTQRLRSALSALVVADNLLDRSVADDAYQAVASLVTPDASVDLLKFLLVYHTSFGRLSEGVDAAGALLLRRSELSRTQLTATLRWCSIPMKRAGRFDTCHALLREAVELAEARGMWIEFASTSNYLSVLACDSGNVEEATAWQARISHHARHLADQFLELDRGEILARVALLRGDPTEARRQLDLLPCSTVRLARASLLIRALDVECDRQLGHLSASDPRLTQLESLHLKARGCGDHDLVASALTAALASTGRAARARRLWAEYVRIYRRETGAIGAYAGWIEKQIAPLASPV